MPDDRRPGKGRSLKALPVVLGAATAKSMKVRMKTTSAGPDGIRHPDQVFDLPKAEANDLIKAGAAVAVPSAGRKAESTLVEPIPKEPFTDEGLRYGVEPDPFMKWYDPEAYRDGLKTDETVRRLKKRFSEALKREYELRYLPFDNPAAVFAPLTRATATADSRCGSWS